MSAHGGGRGTTRQSLRLTLRNRGKCLDVRDVSPANGARLQQLTCTGGPAQSFRLAQQ